MLTTANQIMAQEPIQTSDSKLLKYISNGINTVLIASILYIGTTLQSNSATLVRLEEGQKNQNRILESIQPKVDLAYDTGRQNNQELVNIRQRLDRLENRPTNR